MFSNSLNLENLISLYFLHPALFQEELDYMYLDSFSDSDTFLENIQMLFSGDLPQDVPWIWDMWAKDTSLPWRSMLAKVVSPVATKIYDEEYRRQLEMDERADREDALEAMSVHNLSDDQLADMGMIRCAECGHILTFNGGDWYICDHGDCTCTKCSKQVIEQ